MHICFGNLICVYTCVLIKAFLSAQNDASELQFPVVAKDIQIAFLKQYPLSLSLRASLVDRDLRMDNDKEPELHVMEVLVSREANSANQAVANKQAPMHHLKNRKWRLRIVVYALFVLFGQSVATLLGRFYYNNGGKSIWLAALMETLGFPILIPFSLHFSPPKGPSNHKNSTDKKPSALILATIYASFGILQAADNMLYSIGLLHLPVSTYSLICATQLVFNAFFSFFLNAQKLTPPIVNSIVILTISVTLIVLQSGSENPRTISRRKYSIGFSCTITASVLYALLLSLTQLFFQKVLRKETFHVVLKMIIYQSLVASCVSIVALFASKGWNGLRNEMENFERGKGSYLMILVGIAVAWQLFTIGAVGLIFEVSSLFSNVISTMALPIVPSLAVIFFHDKMDGVKIIAMLLAVWGFASYVYQNYLDDSKSQTDRVNVNASEPFPTERY